MRYRAFVLAHTFQESTAGEEGTPHVLERVVDARAGGHEEAGPGRHAVEEEQLLLRAQRAVVALARLLHAVPVVLHQRRLREGDAVHPLLCTQLTVTTTISASWSLNIAPHPSASCREVMLYHSLTCMPK